MYRLENFQNKPLAEQVENHILSYIVDNNLETGDKIPNEFELAGKLGVGRGTVREAIKMLISKNVLEIRRGSGTFVKNTHTVEYDPLGISGMKDRHKLALEIFEVRLMLEPEIAVLAAKNASKSDIGELRRLCDEVEEKILTGINHIEADIRFHTCMAKCSKNRVVENLIPIINSSVAMFVNITHRKLQEETIRTHRDIVDAIGRHDGTGAKCAVIMHLTYNRQMILKIIEEEKKPGE